MITPDWFMGMVTKQKEFYDVLLWNSCCFNTKYEEWMVSKAAEERQSW